MWGWSEDGEAAKPGFAPLRELPAAGAFTVDPVWLLLHANFGLFRYCAHSISATAAHVGKLSLPRIPDCSANKKMIDSII